MSDAIPPANALTTKLALLTGALELAAQMSRELAADIGPLLESHPASARRRGPGRRPVIPTHEQVREVLRLRKVNGRLGIKEIGRRVEPPLGWEVVQRIIDTYEAASGNRPETSGKPIAPPDTTAPSEKKPRKGGD